MGSSLHQNFAVAFFCYLLTKKALPFFGKCFFCVCVRRTQHRLRVYSQHHLTVRSTSLSEYGHKTMLRLRRKYTPTREIYGIICNIRAVIAMKDDKLSDLSMQLSVDILKLTRDTRARFCCVDRVVNL